MPRSIKEVVRGYMQGCKEEARKQGFTENLYDGPPFYRVLTHKGQLHAMIEYVKANAERAWQRKQNPDLFRMRRTTEMCGLQFTSMGNHFLSDWPDRQLVEMSRSASDEQKSERLRSVLAAAHNGAVTYTAAVSDGEKMIAGAVREQHPIYRFLSLLPLQVRWRRVLPRWVQQARACGRGGCRVRREDRGE